jgi:hypothetical protein
VGGHGEADISGQRVEQGEGKRAHGARKARGRKPNHTHRVSACGQVDGEVRDKILCMVEDYAKVLPQAEYRETYETLLVCVCCVCVCARVRVSA